MKLTNEIKNEIIKDYNEKMKPLDIIAKYNVSKATYYRIIKELNISKNEVSVITKNESLHNEDENESNENENKSTNESVNESNNVSLFNKEQFKKELNDDNDFLPSNVQEQELDNNDENNVSKSFTKYNNTYSNNNKPIYNNNDVSNLSNISFNKNNNKKTNNQNNKSDIMDTIKQVNNADSIDELKEKRTIIIMIRSYILTFEKQLQNIYGNNKSQFEKQLFLLDINKLKIILENIRVQMNLSRNKEIFDNSVSIGLKGIETISTYCNFNVKGLTEELMNDPQFQLDLKIISCETDLTKYINPRSSAFLKVVKTMYQINSKNELEDKIKNVINDPNKFERINNLDKKI